MYISKVDELVLDVNFPCLIGYKPRGIKLLPSNHGWPKLFSNPDASREVQCLSCPHFPRSVTWSVSVVTIHIMPIDADYQEPGESPGSPNPDLRGDGGA